MALAQLRSQVGSSDFDQGEMLRAVEKLRWEAQNNGNGNWDDRFEMFIIFLESTISSEVRLPEHLRNVAAEDLERLRNFDSPYMEDDLYDRLTNVVIAFSRLNQKLVDRPINPRQYR